ncbi:FAT domain-containing family protein [Salix suchowensis]|nr:FAT domain-containing family protein [Salix suchowensis]
MLPWVVSCWSTLRNGWNLTSFPRVSWKAGEEPKIAAAIIELFHLLPHAASKFLDELVTLTIDLEGALPSGQVYSELNSPYRLPLTKFLNRYATHAVDYFLARLNDPKYFRRFMYILRSDAGQPLRDELAKSPQKILASAFPEFLPKSDVEMSSNSSTPPPALLGEESLVAPPADSANLPTIPNVATSDAYFQGLALIKMLVKLIPSWLHSNQPVFDTLVLVWKSPARVSRLYNEQELNLVQVKESKWLVKCFLNYLRHDKTEVNVLFDILSIFLLHSRIDFTFLKEFYIIEVAEGYPPNMKRALLLHFLNLFQSKQLGHDHLVVVMQMLILPMLAHAFQNGQSWEVVDPGIIKTIVDKLLDPPEEVSAEYDEPLRIELLQLATLLLKYLQNDLVQHRKELIKFGWNHLKREDSASKQWAFVNVCHFLEAYQAPEKIILQVFVALLRTCQPENKLLVKQALDILMPALPRRLPLACCAPFRSLLQLQSTICSPNGQFSQSAWTAIQHNNENRRLAIELAGLVVGWERQRQHEMKAMTDGDVPSQSNDGFNPGSAGTDSKRAVDGSTFPEDASKRVKVEPGLQSICVMSPGGASSILNIETPGPGVQPDEEFKPNAAMEEMIINFLIRGQRTDPDSAVSSRQGADLGAVISNLKSVLKLICEKVMVVPDCKRSVTQVLNALLSEKGTDAGMWIEDDFCKPGRVTSSGFISPKEIVSFLQKLSQVDKQSFSHDAHEDWDRKFLQLLYGICADSKYSLPLRQEVFQKVERQFMLGLRARDPEIRKKFFLLYHESLRKSLFIRLQYIIQLQDREALSDVIWLKQGLDLLLAILVEDKPITLAPNSARVQPVVVSSSLPDSSGMQQLVADVPEGSEEVPLTFDSLVLKHAQFLNEMNKLQVADLVIPLRELAHTDANVAYHLWVLVFPIVWVTLHKEEQSLTLWLGRSDFLFLFYIASFISVMFFTLYIAYTLLAIPHLVMFSSYILYFSKALQRGVIFLFHYFHDLSLLFLSIKLSFVYMILSSSLRCIGIDWLSMKDAFLGAVLNLQVSVEHSKEVSDCKNLIKTLVMGMKTIIWSITHAHLPRSQVSPSTHGTHSQVLVSPSSSLPAPQAFKGMREDEKASGVLKSGVHCLALFKEKDEERDMLNLFSQILSIMEPRDLMDMFSLCMPELFECMISNTQLVHIFSSLLQSSKVYRPFADVLVNFLACSKLDVLKNPDSPAAKLVLNLFRFIFGAVSKAPAEFERILQPHVLVIMEVCMKNATEVEKPLGYMQLLQTMFRALAGCKFDLLLRDLIPMLQPCLNMLLTMLEGPTGEDMRDLLLELCLTMPARLSSLLPHLPRLMRPLVLCLKGSDDLVSLGLSTLEFWVDSLNPDFLEPSMANVMSEVILSLWSHLRPAPYPWGGKALQLLGKLGGRNRRFLKEPLALECKDNPEHGLRLILTFEPSTPFLVPLDRCINLAVAAVINKSNGMDAFYRKQSLKFLCVCLSSQLNLPGNVSDEGCTARQLSTTLVSAVDSSWHRSEASDIKADLGVKTKTQLMAEKSVFKILLMTIIASSAEPDLHDPKDNFVVNVCRHFAMIFHIDYNSNNPSIPIALGGPMLSSSSSVSSRSKTSTNLKELDPLIFLDALVDVLSDDNRVHAKAALGALNVFAETVLFLARSKHGDALMSRAGPGTPMIVSSPSMNPVYSPPPSVCIPVFEQLLPRLLHCCYGTTWQAQMGGVMGLGALVGKVTVETLCHFQVRIVRGLVYVLERLPPYASKEQEEASQVLTQVLRVVNNVDEANSEQRRKKLFNPNASIIVRKNVQSCLALLASRTGSEVSELLEPLYQPLLQPLITRPLRSKTVEQQVGIVTALNFCLALRPPLLKLTQELVNFLQEALQIAEADGNVWVVKFVNPKYTLSLNKLRTSCIELLCTAMAWADFKSQNHSELRAKIISMFFKSLTCRTPEIVAVAKEGLRQVINQQRMPKELLQSSLRPILVNLAHTKNLSMPLLQGLARLLELLSSWFNVTLGGKLLEHLKKWMEPDKLSQSIKSWKAGEEPKIAAAIIELFHLLPHASSKFLDELVTLTIDLEGALPSGQVYSELNSPYRLPLTKFLNRYATLAVDYFLARLNDPKYFRRFMYILRSDAGQPLRDELAKSPQKILASAFPEFLPKSDVEMSSNSSTPPPALLGEESLVAPPADSANLPTIPNVATSDAYFQGLALIKMLVKLIPSWLHSNQPVFDTLVLVWKSPARVSRLYNEQELNLVQVKESIWLVKCFLNYLRHDKTEVNVLFDILSIFLLHSRIDFTFLKEFYIIEVAEGYPPNMKRALLLHFLNLFQSKQLGHDHLVVVMQMLILPMLAHAFQNGQSWEVVDPGIIKTIVDKLLDQPEEVSAEYDEPLRIELLQLATLLLKYLQNDLVQHRKELIKFGWNHLKREDSASKQWAFVNVCHFLEAYQAPEKIILQVFVALLRTCQPENKLLVKQALDILMPALPRRLPLACCAPFRSLLQLQSTICSPNGQFSQSAWTAIQHNNENRRLAIELAGLVVGWERQRQHEMKAMTDGDVPSQSNDGFNPGSAGTDSKRAVDGSTFPEDASKRVKVEPGLQSICVMSPGGASSIPNIETPGPGVQPDEEFKPNAAMEEMIINFLIRVALVIKAKDK